MQEITRENLAQFKPKTDDYETRLADFIEDVGLESGMQRKSYGAALRRVNRESAIGFSKEEMQVLDLIYTMDERNERFDNDTHIQPGHGGNTAEHPIFMSLAFDKFKDKAGLGADSFDPNSEESLKLAKLSQKVHALIAVHDAGEVVDVSFGEQKLTDAEFKEPAEEALVGPFKFKLAAYALSVGMPELYAETITKIKDSVREAKQELFEWAMLKNPEEIAEFEKGMQSRWALEADKAENPQDENRGNRFVRAFGKVIGEKIAAEEARMGEHAMPEAYQKAADTLGDLFREAEEEKNPTLANRLLRLTDKFEGSFHYAHFAGKATKDYAAEHPTDDPEQTLMNRMFGDGRSASFTLARSGMVEGQVTYPQKFCTLAFAAVDKEEGVDKEIADKLVRAATADILRDTIVILQKSPPLVDFSKRQEDEEPVAKGLSPEGKSNSFAMRLNVQRKLLDEFGAAANVRDREVTTLEGVVDTKAIIAVHEKAAELLESGQWRPDSSAKMVVPVRGPLPEALHVTREEIKGAIRRYPMDVSSDFANDEFQGERVRIGRTR